MSVSFHATKEPGQILTAHHQISGEIADTHAALSIFARQRAEHRPLLRRETLCLDGATSCFKRAKTIADPMLSLILSDINMPDMSGLEMLPKVKAARPDVPVIMITAYGDEATKRKAAELGAAGLLRSTSGYCA